MNKGQGTFQFSALFLFYPSILMVSTNNKLALHPYLPTVNRNSLAEYQNVRYKYLRKMSIIGDKSYKNSSEINLEVSVIP